MNLQGIPFLGEDNFNKKQRILNRGTDECRDTSLYDLFKNIKEKNELVVIDNKWLTWLEDTQFNYVSKIASIIYYSYETIKHRINPNNKYKTKYLNHMDRLDDKNVLIRYNFELNYIDINIGTKLRIYHIDEDKLIEYTIVSWVNNNDTFSVDKLYSLYKNYCFYDANLDFGEHEGGYTYISKEVRRFSNKDASVRRELGLDTYKNKDNKCIEYRDVRIYNYFEYLSKISKKDEISIKLFKYRRIEFENYLFCHLRNNSIPYDYPEWNQLGNSKKYIKITDGHIPFFIKHEWLNNTKLTSNETWRKIKRK